MSQFKQLPDGSVQHSDGRIIVFSWERFKKDIVDGNCCLICGAEKDSKPFNDEHILPRWMLEEFKLFDKRITLPNLSKYTYGQYTVPCCKSCNSMYGEKMEKPISDMIKFGFSEVAQYVEQQNAPGMLFVWLAFIVLKTHLKDRTLKLSQDNRSDDSNRKISDIYSYSAFHHLHCVARTLYTDAAISGTAFGSFIVLPALVDTDSYESFDFADVTTARSVLLRMGEVAIISVLDDSCAALSKFDPILKRISGPLAPIQLREILAHFSYISASLEERPQHHSAIKNDEYSIFSTHPPKVAIEQNDKNLFGEYFSALCGPLLPPEQRANLSTAMKNGDCSFLFKENGDFISYSK